MEIVLLSVETYLLNIIKFWCWYFGLLHSSLDALAVTGCLNVESVSARGN